MTYDLRLLENNHIAKALADKVLTAYENFCDEIDAEDVSLEDYVFGSDDFMEDLDGLLEDAPEEDAIELLSYPPYVYLGLAKAMQWENERMVDYKFAEHERDQQAISRERTGRYSI